MVALRGLRAAAAAAATAAVIAGGNSIMGSGQEGGFATIVVDNQGFGGGVVRMEARGGALLYENAWGTLAHGSREPLAPSTPFEIASITKMFTATAILLLIDNGTLASLSQPLSLAAPRLLLHLGDGGGGAPRHWRNVTLQQLLQHTSGLDDYWQDPAFQRAFEADEQRLWTPMELLGYAMHMSPLTTSATSSNHNSSNNNGYHYSDTNYVLLGLVVEEAAGMPLGQYFQKAIFEPLGMNSTYFNHLEPLRTPTLAHRYEGHEDLTTKRRQSADWAGGGLVSTTMDLNRFVLEGLVGGRLGQRQGQGQGLLRQMQAAPVPTGTMEGVAYGLGMFVIDAEEELGSKGARVWGHEGWGHSFVWVDEQAGMVVSGTVNQQDEEERADPWDAVMALMVAGRRALVSE